MTTQHKYRQKISGEQSTDISSVECDRALQHKYRQKTHQQWLVIATQYTDRRLAGRKLLVACVSELNLKTQTADKWGTKLNRKLKHINRS